MFDAAQSLAEWLEAPDAFYSLDPMIASEELLAMLSADHRAILDEETWASMLQVACPPPDADSDAQLRANSWIGAIAEGLRAWSFRVGDSHDASAVTNAQEALEKWFFIIRMHFWRLSGILERTLGELEQQAPSGGPRRRGKNGSAKEKELSATVAQPLSSLLDAVARTLNGGIEKVFGNDADAKRRTLAMLYLEPTCHLLHHQYLCENAELAQYIVKVLCLSVKLQRQSTMICDCFVQLVSLYEHATTLTVRTIELLIDQFNYTALASSVLRELAHNAQQWNEDKSLEQAKNLSAFLLLYAERIPNSFVQNFSAVAPLFASPAPQLRQAMIDVAKQIISLVSEKLDSSPRADGDASIEKAPGAEAEKEDPSSAKLSSQKLAEELLHTLMTHANDTSFFCRRRAVENLADLVGSRVTTGKRLEIARIASEKVKDRAQLVRKSAIKLLMRLMATHPGIFPENRLNLDRWRHTLAEVEAQSEKGASPAIAATEADEEESAENHLAQLEIMAMFCEDTIKFILTINDALETARKLLLSRNRGDIVDAIDLLVFAEAYDVVASRPGIRSIVHLVWTKADNDENNAVCAKAVSTYISMFLTPSPDLTQAQGDRFVADTLIHLAIDSDESELTSLEQMLYIIMEQGQLERGVVSCLWATYREDLTLPKQRCGAAIILGMLAAKDGSIARAEFAALKGVGLGHRGRNDLSLAGYSCVILRRAADTEIGSKLPFDSDVFEKVGALISTPFIDQPLQWSRFAREALRMACDLCDVPPNLYSQILRQLWRKVFGDMSSSQDPQQRQALFQQMLFVVGEVALNLLVYLERSELEFKQMNQRAATEQLRQEDADMEQEMMAGGGSSEDAFVDAINEVREYELLYSEQSLLRPFTGMIVRLCEQELERPSSGLAAVSATQTLAKLACVSSAFCKDHLPLIFRLLNDHPDEVVRSNLVVAVSDIAIRFNRLMDEHTERLYGKLQDQAPMVQRTCIVALTFLILAGQIKVKGQLGQMAKAMTSANPKISALATMFFRELSTKDNAIYNSFLDMLSTVVADESVSEADAQRILRFLAELVDKDRHMKQLTEKIKVRMSRCETKRQWSAYVTVLKSFKRKMDDDIRALIEQGFQPVRRESGANADDDDDDDDDLVDAVGDMSIVPDSPVKAEIAT